MLLAWPMTYFVCKLSRYSCIRRIGLALPSAADLLSDTGGSTGTQSNSLLWQPLCHTLQEPRIPRPYNLLLQCSCLQPPFCCHLCSTSDTRSPCAAVLAELREERVFYDRHHGRVRAFPHKEGNYATHVYIAGVPLKDGRS